MVECAILYSIEIREDLVIIFRTFLLPLSKPVNLYIMKQAGGPLQS